MVRFKNRYLCFEVVYEGGINSATSSAGENLTASEFASIIRDQVQENFGDYGSGNTLGAFNGESTCHAIATIPMSYITAHSY